MALITGRQLKAARALLGWGQRRLAKEAQVSLPTIQRMEASTDAVRGYAETVDKVHHALDVAGIVLIPANGGGPGVRLKEPPDTNSD